jgi:membrane protease YdiL (CAAX protease family)
MFVVGLARILQITLMVMIVRHDAGDLAIIGFSRSELATGLKKGITWALGFGVIAAIICVFVWFLGIDVFNLFKAPTTSSFTSVMLLFIVGALMGPIAEEFLFRGIIFGFFRKWGFVPALMISTAIFVVPHFTGNNIPLTQLVGGLLFAIAYEIEKNLFVPIVIHCLGNLSIFSLSYIA